MKLKLFQTSGPALFMYTVIACCLIASGVCFYVYYGAILIEEPILWIGVTTFTILYHFWGRIILGNVSKLFKRFRGKNQLFLYLLTGYSVFYKTSRNLLTTIVLTSQNN